MLGGTVTSDSALAIAILIAIAAFAIMYRPTSHFGHWAQLAQSFETDRKPARITYPDERLYVGHLTQPRFFWFPWQRRFWQMDDGEYVLFDVECDTDGLWLNHKGQDRGECADMMLIPWGYITKRKEYSNQVVLKVATEYHIDLRVPRHIGDRCLTYIQNVAWHTTSLDTGRFGIGASGILYRVQAAAGQTNCLQRIDHGTA